MPIDRINSYSARFAVFGWLVGLAYQGWWSASAPSVPLWGWVVLVIGGMFAASLIVAGGLAALSALATKLVLGDAHRSPNAYSWAAFLSPVVALWLAGWTVQAAFA